jgi:hypothetical protein
VFLLTWERSRNVFIIVTIMEFTRLPFLTGACKCWMKHGNLALTWLSKAIISFKPTFWFRVRYNQLDNDIRCKKLRNKMRTYCLARCRAEYPHFIAKRVFLIWLKVCPFFETESSLIYIFTYTIFVMLSDIITSF